MIALLPQLLLHYFQHHAILIACLSLLTMSFSLYKLGRRNKPSKKLNLPPSPPKLPLIGNLHQLGSIPHQTLRTLSNKYGPLMLLYLGRIPTVVISSTAVAEEMTKTHDLVFSSRPSSSIYNRLFYNCQDVGFAPYGEYWRQVRKICVLHLLTLKRVQSFRSVREEEVTIMVEKIRSSSALGPVDMTATLITLTYDIICRVVLGKKYPSTGARKMLEEVMVLMGESPVGDFIPGLSWLDRWSGLDARVGKTFSEVDAFLDKVVEDHIHGEKSHDGEDFVDVLLSLDAKGSDDMGGFSLTRDCIKALILDMLVAGTDSTFTALEWTMTELIRHPESMKRVQEEVRSVEVIKEKELDHMRYLKAVIKEVLRLHPPGTLLIPRETTEDVRLYGYDIPARTRVLVNAWAIGRDPKSWDLPEEFRPDRFMDSSVDFKGHDFQLIPFGVGRRGCPGIEFTVPTLELTLATLLRHFDWTLPSGTNMETMDITEKFGLTTRKKSNLILVPKLI
nr:cytochrome P450 [Paris polyphylla]